MATSTRPKPDGAGNSFRAARDLGAFADRSIIIDDAVGVNDRSDYYRLRISRSSYAAIALTGLKANADLELFDARFRRIGALNNPGTRREFSAGGNTPAGVYYLRVFPRGAGDTTYRLTILTITN